MLRFRISEKNTGNKGKDKSTSLSNRRQQEKDYVDLQKQVELLKHREINLNKKTASLVKRNLKLAELNQIKDEFIGIASHQLRTPATGVKQYLNLLLDGFAEELTPNQRLFLERAHESNDRQLRIIDDLLRVARVDSETFKLRKADVDLSAVVEGVIDELKSKLKEHQQSIHFDKPKRKVIIHVDPERLRMVLENVLDNAINYSMQNTSINISIKNELRDVKIIIKDEGVGISKSDFPKLFQKFSRIPNPLSVEVGGTGLGLYWANKVVTLHGGLIEVKSVVGKGSSFIIVLPKGKTINKK